MATPSLAMIPVAYKAAKIYSQVPSDGTGDFTVTRASSATRVNKDGFIESVADNVARLDYSNGSCAELLVEPQSTNNISYSEELTNGWWSKSAVTVTDNIEISPDGTQNASKIEDTLVSDLHALFRNNIPVTASVDYTVSVFTKANSDKNVLIRTIDSAANIKQSYFDLSTGSVVSTSSGSTANIEDYGNGWYRCSQSRTDDSGGGDVDVQIALVVGTGLTYLGDGSSHFFWGLQLEELSYPTSYTPNNTGGSVSRLKDAITDGGDSNTFNSSEGVLFVESRALSDDLTFRELSISDGTVSNRVTVSYHSISNSVRAIYQTGGVSQTELTSVVSDIKSLNKIAIRYQVNNFSLWINGVKVGEDLVGSVGGVFDRLEFANGANNSSWFYGRVKKLEVFNTFLSDADMAKLTT